MNDPMKARALRLLEEFYRRYWEGPEVLNEAAEAAGIAPGTRTFRAVVNYLERERAIEEATDLPYVNPTTTFYRITPTGKAMLREEGLL